MTNPGEVSRLPQDLAQDYYLAESGNGSERVWQIVAHLADGQIIPASDHYTDLQEAADELTRLPQEEPWSHFEDMFCHLPVHTQDYYLRSQEYLLESGNGSKRWWQIVAHLSDGETCLCTAPFTDLQEAVDELTRLRLERSHRSS
jgi:hypothetical protein